MKDKKRERELYKRFKQGTLNFISRLKANSTEHQNIFNAPLLYEDMYEPELDRSTLVPIDCDNQEFGEPIFVPREAIDSCEAYDGYYYFSNFEKLLDFAVDSDDIH